MRNWHETALSKLRWRACSPPSPQAFLAVKHEDSVADFKMGGGANPNTMHTLIGKVESGNNLSRQEAEAAMDEIMTGACQRANLPRLTCHQLRHTCFTRLREAGMALEAIQAQAGHRSIESTRIYLHLANDWLANEYRRAAEAIEAEAMASS